MILVYRVVGKNCDISKDCQSKITYLLDLYCNIFDNIEHF